MKRYGHYIFLLSMLISCATTPAKRVEIVYKEIFPTSFDKTWYAIIEILSERAMPIEAEEKDSRIITTKFINFASGLTATNTVKRVANTPVGTLTSFENGRYTLKAFVTPVGESSTRVSLTCHIEAFGGGLEGKIWGFYLKILLLPLEVLRPPYPSPSMHRYLWIQPCLVHLNLENNP